MKRHLAITFLLAAGIVAPRPARADDIYLKSGKILSGRIVGETDRSYRMKLGVGMYLNIEKADVRNISRDTPRRTVVTTPNAAAPAPHPAPAKPAAPAASPAPLKKSTPAAAPASSAQTDTGASHRTIGAVNLTSTVAPAFYDVRGRTMEDVERAITDREKGVGFLVYDEREPSTTTWRASWDGQPSANGSAWKSLVVVATITPTFPAWKPEPADAAKWEALLAERRKIEAEHAKIIRESLASFAQAASNLRAADAKSLRERTAKLLDEYRARADNRLDGYDRRRLEPKRPLRLRKKPKH